MPASTATLRAYRLTTYAAAGLQVRIGRGCTEAGRLLGGKQGGFLSAANPYSRRHPDGLNERRNLILEQWLQRLPHWPGEGRHLRWSEPHFLVRADHRRLLVLARRFRQSAIVALDPPRPARLLLRAFPGACSHPTTPLRAGRTSR